MPPFHSSTMCDPAAKFSGKFRIIFFCFLWSSSVSSWLVRCSSSVSFFSDSVWLRFEAKKLSIVQTCFWCDMLKIARCVHHTWLMMRCKQTTCDKIHFPRSVLACNFCTELTLFMCASNSSFFLKFWSLRDNFYLSVGLAQWRRLAQTLFCTMLFSIDVHWNTPWLNWWNCLLDV